MQRIDDNSFIVVVHYTGSRFTNKNLLFCYVSSKKVSDVRHNLTGKGWMLLMTALFISFSRSIWRWVTC
jgi:hypothetical protein